MICRTRGAPIADKALICYRCGEAVAEPAVQSHVQQSSRRGPMLSVLVLVVVALAALLTARSVEGEVPEALMWVVFGLAVTIAVRRVSASRRRR